MLLVLGSAPAILAIHCERIRSKLISFCATTTFVRCICKEQEKQLLVSYTTNKTILVYIDNLSSRTKKETCIYRRGPQDGQNCCLIYPSFFYQSMCACVCVRACVWVLGGDVCVCVFACVRACVRVCDVCVCERERKITVFNARSTMTVISGRKWEREKEGRNCVAYWPQLPIPGKIKFKRYTDYVNLQTRKQYHQAETNAYSMSFVYLALCSKAFCRSTTGLLCVELPIQLPIC